MRPAVLARYALKDQLLDALNLLPNLLLSLYTVAAYYASIGAISREFAVLSGAGLVLTYALWGTSPRPFVYDLSPASPLSELPITPLQYYAVFRLASALISSLLSLVKLAALLLLVPALPARLDPLMVALLVGAVIGNLFYNAAMNSAIGYTSQKTMMALARLQGRRGRRLQEPIRNLVTNFVISLTSFVYLSAPVYFTLEAMPGWARIFALANPVTFCIEAARGYAGPYLALVPLQVALWVAADVALFAKMAKA